MKKTISINTLEEGESRIFSLIRLGHFSEVENLIMNNKIDINLSDENGNSILFNLLKGKEYDLILNCLSKRKLDLNHQNKDGNTLGHLLIKEGSVHSIKILMELAKKKNYLLDTKNRLGETILDRLLVSKYNYLAIKIIEEKRFNDIDINCFTKLINLYVNNGKYGKYTKLDNLQLIIKSLDKKDDLLPCVKEIVESIKKNLEIVKYEIEKNKFLFINMLITEATA